jgi:hypothetical protein
VSPTTRASLRRLGFIVEFAMLLAIIVFAVATLAFGANTTALAGLAAAVAAVIAFLLKWSQPSDQTQNAKYVQRLVDEAAFATSYGEVAAVETPDVLLDLMRVRLKDPVLIPRGPARKALDHAEMVYGRSAAWLRAREQAGDGEPPTPRPFDNPPLEMIMPLEPIVPKGRVYLEKLQEIPSERRVPAFSAGYQLAYQAGHDRLAWRYMTFLADLGEKATLEKILVERLITMINKGGGYAYPATLDLAREIEGVQFDDWFARNVKPHLEEDEDDHV